ncbi:hypothetical protein QJS04_geneDACA003058 [Acorus gramineus]|uniref:Uncharacterized protein n=1 Tax=Acorus gramineus TaxID=55184 RepID=A0AAV9BSW9_ACOGR|nr:hypothetical protein QJS04_geneDACA003058 [Acorus gramineus]
MTTTIHGSSSNQTCPTYPACGEAKNFDIRYPFWLTDSTKTTNCGYPTFGLTCKDNKFPLFRLSNKDYYLTYIDYNKNVIILLDIDFYYNPCPRPHQNFTISDNPILTFTQYDQNLTFFFNCSTSPSKTTNTSRPACLGGRSYVTTEELGKFNGWYSGCEEAVVVPAIGYLVNKTASDLADSIHQLLNGFGLGWKVPLECERCEGSGGVCLHENKSFSGCLCDGGVRTSDHCVDTGMDFWFF